MNNPVELLIRENKGAVEVINTLSDGASFRIAVEDGEDVIVSKSDKSYAVTPLNAGHRPDFTIFTNFEVINKAFNSCEKCDDAKTFLVNSLKTLMNGENRKHVSLSVHSGLIRLTLNGYFKIFSLGGRQFLKTLSEHGIGSVSTIRKKLANFTNR